MHIHSQILRHLILFSVFPMVWFSFLHKMYSKSLWTSTLGSFMHPKWRQQGLGHPLRTMFLFQDADAKQQESWSCIWLELVRLYKLLFSLPPHCPGDCLIVLLKLSPLIPVSLLWCSSWEIQGIVQPVLMRVLYRALANKMCREQGGSIRDAWMICLTCLFH